MESQHKGFYFISGAWLIAWCLIVGGALAVGIHAQQPKPATAEQKAQQWGAPCYQGLGLEWVCGDGKSTKGKQTSHAQSSHLPGHGQSFVVIGDDGQPVLTVYSDGTVEFRKGVPVTDATKQFVEAVRQIMPCSSTPAKAQ